MTAKTLNLIRLVYFNSTFDCCFEIEVIATDFFVYELKFSYCDSDQYWEVK